MVISKLSVVGLVQKDGEMAAGDLIAYYPTPTDSLEILYGTRLFSKGEMLLRPKHLLRVRRGGL
jgi:hypothetical protein